MRRSSSPAGEHKEATRSLSFPQARASLVTRVPTGWSGKTFMLFFVCFVAIATSGDFWSAATTSPSSGLLVVADDDDPDGSDERMPASASGAVGYIDIRCFVRMARVAIEQVDRRSAPLSRLTTRGPPNQGSNHREFQNALSPETVTVRNSSSTPLSPPSGRRAPQCWTRPPRGTTRSSAAVTCPNDRTSRRPS